MFSKIKNKLFEAIANRNPVYKAAVKEGREALALCPLLLA
jgi:ubiquitin